MSRTYTYYQHRDDDPDYSNEEERAELAARLLDTVPELITMDPTDGVIEACSRVGFNGFDCETLRLLARRTGEFPVSFQLPKTATSNHSHYTIRLGWASQALRSSRTKNPDFWEDEALVQEAARQAPEVWEQVKAELDREVRRIEFVLSRGGH
ncbi:hypothetical protein [uncultured Roseobacter sp.]|uniref:hypothetical protein n=1 Tax=uncultured Roseobacter sp. TaxID=114847 RepID=UPI0026188D39|nr:hypothetical protein [uncultured Roseobacter sp.]